MTSFLGNIIKLKGIWQAKIMSQHSIFKTLHCIKNVSVLRLFLNWISIATVSSFSVSEYPIPRNTPYPNTENKSSCMCCICGYIPAMSTLYSNSPHWNRILFTNRYRCQISKELHLQALKQLHELSCRWSQTLSGYSVFNLPWHTRRSLWKQHANLSLPFWARTPQHIVGVVYKNVLQM